MFSVITKEGPSQRLKDHSNRPVRGPGIADFFHDLRHIFEPLRHERWKYKGATKDTRSQDDTDDHEIFSPIKRVCQGRDTNNERSHWRMSQNCHKIN